MVQFARENTTVEPAKFCGIQACGSGDSISFVRPIQDQKCSISRKPVAEKFEKVIEVERALRMLGNIRTYFSNVLEKITLHRLQNCKNTAEKSEVSKKIRSRKVERC